MELRITLTHEHAKQPVRGSPESAGLDLFSVEDKYIEPFGKALISTGLSIEIAQGFYGRIAPRSSMAWKKHSDIGAGVIDSDYRGNVGIVLFNLSSTEPIEIKVGDKIAQIIIEKTYYPEIIICNDDELSKTERGEGGFGSTGR
tara:strand:+ start:2351 stop:2782 length:432 start_codon:yes stop_codon:yes gene_type:complete